MPFNIKLDCLLARRKSINQYNVRYRRPRMPSVAQMTTSTGTIENTIQPGSKNRCEAANILGKFPGNVAETSQIRGSKLMTSLDICPENPDAIHKFSYHPPKRQVVSLGPTNII